VWLLAIGKILHQFARRKNVANAITLMGAKASVTNVSFLPRFHVKNYTNATSFLYVYILKFLISI
jgi:hypothetical protein